MSRSVCLTFSFEISELHLVFSECTLISCCQELNLPIYGNVNVVATFLCGLDMPLSSEEVPPSLTWSVRFFEKIASRSELSTPGAIIRNVQFLRKVLEYF